MKDISEATNPALRGSLAALRRAAEEARRQQDASALPDAGGHAAGAAERPGITSVGEEQRRP